MVKCTFDIEKFTQKPDKEAAKRISNRIAKYAVELTIEQIAEKLVQPHGYTFTPGVFTEGKRRINNWKSQQIFGLDFDEGLTIEQVLERCEKYNIKPAIIYTTFSSVNDNKFRVLFVHESEVTDFRVQKLIQLALMRMFFESDRACKDSARVFYGGQELKHVDNTAVFNGALLVQEMCRYISDTDKAHAAREIKNYCASVGLDMVNGLPKILPVVDEEVENMSKFGETTATPIDKSILYRTRAKSPKYEVFFNKGNTSAKGAAKEKTKYSVTNEKIPRNEIIRNFDFEQLEKTCELYKDFCEQKFRLDHATRTGIATNLCCIESGRKKFITALEKGNEIEAERYDVEKWEYYLNYFNKQNYAPMRCDHFCEYAKDCPHARNMIEQVNLPRGTVRVLEEQQYITLEQAEQKLQDKFTEALNATDTKVYVIKAPTGIGKTRLYTGLHDATIALPTHKLIAEVSQRMTVPHDKTPALPDDYNLNYLYSIGSYMLAKEYIKRKAAEGLEEFKSFLAQDYYCSRGTLLTTHEKLLSLKRPNTTIIIDEDITTTLMPLASTTMDDIETMAKCSPDDRTLQSLYKFAEAASIGLVYPMPSYGLIKTSKFESYILASKINSNVLGFLNCSHFVKYKTDDGIEYITYICKRELPEKQKIIMLSATVNEYICKLLFGDRLVFTDIGEAKPKGSIEQYPQRSYSRYSLDESLKKIAKELAKGKKVITYKSQQEYFDAAMTFGATSGIDEFKGEDIAVIGTPHISPTAYLLLANALGKKPRINDTRTSMSYTKVKRNGFEFWFNTFSNDDILQEIQLYMIESELIQAIGRARLLRNSCTVTVLSNLPIKGASFHYLTKQEIESILTA